MANCLEISKEDELVKEEWTEGTVCWNDWADYKISKVD